MEHRTHGANPDVYPGTADATRRATTGTEEAFDVRRLIPVEREDIPAFTSEEEERAFWDTHSFGPGLLAEMQPVPEAGDEWYPPARPRGTPATRTCCRSS